MSTASSIVVKYPTQINFSPLHAMQLLNNTTYHY